MYQFNKKAIHDLSLFKYLRTMKSTLTTYLFTLLVFISIAIDAQINLPTSITDSLYLGATDTYYYAASNISISATGKLVVDKNVEIRFAPSVRLNVSGTLIVKADKENMATFTCSDTNAHWGYINANSATILINGLYINHGTRFINASYGDITIIDSKVENTTGVIGDDCVGVHNASTLLITGCYLDGDPTKPRIDALDCDAIKDGLITNNIIKNFEDDGVDIGTSTASVLIENNYIYNCNFGISVGENSKVTAKRNIIVKCDAGMQSHTGSTITAYNNTFYANRKGFECHHGSAGGTGGTMIINSCILSKSVNGLVTLQPSSSFTSTYSLCDTDTLEGDSNLFGNPQFVASSDTFDFRLTAGSPCINSGDPALPLDSAGNYVDMGAIEFIQTPDAIVEKAKKIATIAVYPNPSKGKVNLENTTGYNVEIAIYNITGRLIWSQTLSENSVINAYLKTGIYLLKSSLDTGEINIEKIIIE